MIHADEERDVVGTGVRRLPPAKGNNDGNASR